MVDPEPNFEDLPARAQLHRLRQVAVAALADYPIEAARVRVLAHAYNTTFRVDTADGRRFALRVNTARDKPSGELAAELAWLDALASETQVVVPAPVATSAGSLHTSRFCPSLDRDLPVVLMSWLPGRDLDVPTPAAMRELGRITAQLHDHAERWQLPVGATLPSHADVLVGDPNRLSADRGVPADSRAVIEAALAVAQAATDRVIAATHPHVLHADLHPWNVKWLRGRMAVFDFDDMLIGAPVQDLAISSYYLRDDAACRAALFEGYAELRSVPDIADADFEALLAGRNLLLLNDVVGSRHAATIALRPTYEANTVTKLRAFLATGRFRHRVPGLIPSG